MSDKEDGGNDGGNEETESPAAPKKSKRMIEAEKQLAELKTWKEANLLPQRAEERKRYLRLMGNKEKDVVTDAAAATTTTTEPETAADAVAPSSHSSPKKISFKHIPHPPSRSSASSNAVRVIGASDRLYPRYLMQPPVWGPSKDKDAKGEGKEEQGEEKGEGETDAEAGGTGVQKPPLGQRPWEGKPLGELKKQVDPPPRRLTPKEMTDFIGKMYDLEKVKRNTRDANRLKKLDRALPPPKPPLKKEQLEALVDRMYKLALTKAEVKEKNRKTYLEKHAPVQQAKQHGPMKPGELAELQKRLVEQPLIKAQTITRNLERKYVFEPPTKRLSPAEQQELVRKMYTASLEHAAATHATLQRKYVEDVAPKFAQRSRAEMESHALELYQKNNPAVATTQ